jgi:hypothetical protein
MFDELAELHLDLEDGLDAVPARFVPEVGIPVDLMVRFVNPGSIVNALGEEISDTEPHAFAALSALSDASPGGVLECRGELWTVAKATPDGGVFLKLKLHGPLPGVAPED